MDNPFDLIFQRFDALEKMLSDFKRQHKNFNDTKPARKILSITEAADLTKLSKSRLYVLAGKGTIPNFKSGSRVMFFLDELITWIESGRRHSQTEINATADKALLKTKHSM